MYLYYAVTSISANSVEHLLLTESCYLRIKLLTGGTCHEFIAFIPIHPQLAHPRKITVENKILYLPILIGSGNSIALTLRYIWPLSLHTLCPLMGVLGTFHQLKRGRFLCEQIITRGISCLPLLRASKGYSSFRDNANVVT